MRRPRKKLEVSTFPFLAVLLCTMGSLLLLLYIMDSRAKTAAKFRVAEELQARQSRTKAEEDARQAEWEKAKEQLHLSLQQQQDQLVADSQGLVQKFGAVDSKLAIMQTRHGSIEEQVKAESAKIGALHIDIEMQRASLQQTNKQEMLSKAELIAAAKELAELERAFLQLRALKEREKQVHSVVPYRGKRGDERPPIYVECVKDGVVFHPERTPLQGFEFTPRAVHREVERRFGPLTVQQAAKSKDAGQGPYLLFLVRPSGISTYYKAQAALKGFEVDFGYELVEEGWLLDFSSENHAKGSLPSRPQLPWKQVDEKPTIGAAGNKGAGSNSGGLPAFAGDLPNGFRGKTPGNTGGGGPSLLAGGPGTGTTGGASGNSNARGLVLPQPGGPGLGGPLSPAPENSSVTSPTGRPSSPGVDTGIPARPPSFVPIGKGEATPGGGGLGPIDTPMPGNSGGAPRSGSQSEPAGSPGEGNAKSAPLFGSEPGKKPPSAPPLSKLLGNKDFVVTIECRQDAVTVDPSGLIYRWTASNLRETDAALVQTVTNLIARRQASVRPGEPPYRPQLRFRVTSDGLRTYLHVYPLLEQLRVPWTRENVEE